MKPYKPRLVVVLACLSLSNPPFCTCAQIAYQAWLQRYAVSGSAPKTSEATAIAVDANGNVLVTGVVWNGTNHNCVTLKYSNAGVPLWTNRYDGPGKLSHVPSAIAVDQSGNVFVTGSSSMSGSPATAGTDYHYTTVAYSGNGVLLWTNTYSEGGYANAVAVAVDQDGKVFVTGTSADPANNSGNMTTIAYSGAGIPLWTNRYNATGPGGTSAASAMALDSKGNVFVVGYFYGPEGHQHCAVVAYSGAGVPLWTNQYIGPMNLSDGAAAIALGSNGTVFVTGWSSNTNGSTDYLTAAYSGAGVPLWTNRYNAGDASSATAITVNSSGDVVVTGYSWSGVGFPDYATVAYTGAGVPLWTNRYDGPAHGTDEAIAVAADGRGNVFVTGSSAGLGSNYFDNYVTIGYASSGVPLWTNRYTGPANGPDRAAALAVDKGGNVFVTGTSWNGLNWEIATIKYSVVQPIPILVQRLGNQVVLSWTNPVFNLQTAPTPSGAFTNVPSATSPYTNATTAPQQYFRLAHP
jgi:hypothetical protein